MASAASAPHSIKLIAFAASLRRDSHNRRLLTQAVLAARAAEYNHSMPANLKNTIDWISRIRPHLVRGRWARLLSASNTPSGGNRGLGHLRVPLESMGMMIFPDMLSLPMASEAFAEDGTLRDPTSSERLKALTGGCVHAVRRPRS